MDPHPLRNGHRQFRSIGVKGAQAPLTGEALRYSLAAPPLLVGLFATRETFEGNAMADLTRRFMLKATGAMGASMLSLRRGSAAADRGLDASAPVAARAARNASPTAYMFLNLEEAAFIESAVSSVSSLPTPGGQEPLKQACRTISTSNSQAPGVRASGCIGAVHGGRVRPVRATSCPSRLRNYSVRQLERSTGISSHAGTPFGG